MILAMVAMGMSVFILANDFSAMNVALPAMERAFDTDISTIQWVVNAYALVFAMLIVTGGRLADMFGRKRLFFIGTAIFASMSFLGGLADSVYWLIGCRALMGIGGALMWPAVLGMTYSALPKAKAGLAGSLIIGSAGIGQGAGPILGGVLTQYLDWRWVLFVNVPIALAAMLITWRVVHQPAPAQEKERIDYPGIVAISLGLLALLFALDQAPSWGWGDWRIIATLAVGLALVVAFVVIERRAGQQALVPNDVMGNREFRWACIAIALIAPAFFATLLYIPQYFQKILDFSVLRSGIGLLPAMVGFTLLSFVSGTIYDKIGGKLTVGIGAAAMALGPLLLWMTPENATYTDFVPGMVSIGVGLGLFFSPATTAAITSLDPSRTSLAGGIVYMFQIAGGSLGLGLTTTVYATRIQDELGDELRTAGIQTTESQREALHGLLAGTESAQQALSAFPADQADRIGEIVRDAAVAGFQAGMLTVGLLALLSFILVALFVGGPLRLTAAERTAKAALRKAHLHRVHRAHP
jgi:EmrB/QacA subfamily drug resistance transporter